MKDFLEVPAPIDKFLPHGYSYLWEPEILWTHFFSHGLIALSYLAIPFCLLFIAKRRKDLTYRSLLVLFGIFTLSCSATHIISMITIWEPAYRLEGIVKGISALASVATALALIKITPKSMALPTQEEWEKVNEELKEKDKTIQKSEEALLEIEERYQTLLEVFDSVSIYQDGRFVFVNPSTVRLLGATHSNQLIGKKVIDFIHPTYKEIVRTRMLQVLKGERIPRIEEKFVRLDGSEVDVEVIGVPFMYEGKPAVQIVARDITERKLNERILKESEAKFRRLFESDMIGTALWHVGGNILDANNAFLQLTGFSREELESGKLNWQLISPGDYAEQEKQALTQMLDIGVFTPYEKELYRKDGSRVSVIMGGALIEGSTEQAVAFVLDITSLKKARKDLEQRARELAQSNAELEQFAYIASHDLQEPLRTMSGFATLLGKKYKGRLDKDADEFIGFITDAAERMKKLISNLLEYSRVTSKSIPLEPVELTKVVEKVLFSLHTRINESEAHISCEPLPVLPAGEMQMNQLFQNLIGNALKFKDSKPLIITIRARELPEEWEFEVTDTGIGMDMAFSNKIFQVFQRLHSREAYEGTGIGLAICKKIVERHGGKIWVESALGEGSSFYFTLKK